MELNVAVTLKINPESVDTDLDAILEKLDSIASEYGKVHSSEIKPIAFGLKCIEAAILLNDAKGGMEEIAEKLKALDEVSEVDILDVNRL